MLDCEMNIHKGCVKIIEESCIGAFPRKERGNDRISKIVDRFRPEREIKRKLTNQGNPLYQPLSSSSSTPLLLRLMFLFFFFFFFFLYSKFEKGQNFASKFQVLFI